MVIYNYFSVNATISNSTSDGFSFSYCFLVSEDPLLCGLGIWFVIFGVLSARCCSKR